MNTLFYGDNLDVLREHVADESVALIYLDPPFNSKRDYNVLFREGSGEAPASQIKAFDNGVQNQRMTCWAFFPRALLLVFLLCCSYLRAISAASQPVSPRVKLRISRSSYIAVPDKEGADVVFSPRGNRVAVVHKTTGVIIVLNSQSGERLCYISTGSPYITPDDAYNKISKVTFSPDEKSLAVITGTVFNDGRRNLDYVLPTTLPANKAQLWNVETGRLQREFTRARQKEPNLYDVEFSPDGENLALSSIWAPVEVWNAKTGELRWTLPQSQYAMQIFYSLDGRLLVGGRQGSFWHLWDAQTGKHLRVLQNPSGNEIVGFADANTLYGFRGGHTQIQATYWDVRTGKIKRTLSTINRAMHQLKTSALFSPQGDHLVFVDPYNSTVQLQHFGNKATSDSINLIRMPRYSDLLDFYFSPDSKVLVICIAQLSEAVGSVARKNQTIYFFDVNSGRLLMPEPNPGYASILPLLDEHRPMGISPKMPWSGYLVAAVTDMTTVVEMWRVQY
jgi:WD40 repeat protein